MKFLNRKKAEEEEKPAPFEVGLNGTAEELRQANNALKEDIEAKKRKREALVQKKDGLFIDTFKLADARFYSLRDYNDAILYFYDAQYEFTEGACEAFIGGREENLGIILSNPEAFCLEQEYAEELVADALLTLLSKDAAPAAAVAFVFEKAGTDKKQAILDKALYKLFTDRKNDGEDFYRRRADRYEDIENSLAALLEAGADPAYEGNTALAVALYREDSDAIVRMLAEKGANLDEALETMEKYPQHYPYSKDKIKLIRYQTQAEATIQQ